MELKDYADSVFWDEATRRFSQKTLLPVNTQRTEIMGAIDERPQQQPPVQEQTRFSVICSACGKQTTVPFRPNPGRAVYCMDCYNKGCGR